MKRLHFTKLIPLLALSLSLVACGKATTPSADSSSPSSESSSEVISESMEETSSEETLSSEPIEETAVNIYTEWLPSGVEQVMAETKGYPDLITAIVDYYEIPEEYWANTKYYYNYVDLNKDGTDEILALVMGPYTSGTGGDSMLWLAPNETMKVLQDFTLINTPIIVTDEGLVLLRSGGGAESEVVLSSFVDGSYQSVNDATPIEDLSSIKGTAFICNDFIADLENKAFLTLAD